jgi:hypothetical protein
MVVSIPRILFTHDLIVMQFLFVTVVHKHLNVEYAHSFICVYFAPRNSKNFK